MRPCPAPRPAAAPRAARLASRAPLAPLAPLALLALLAIARPAGAQDAARAPDAAARRTTRAGVFSAAQAARGEETYAGMCRACHAPAAHAGAAFAGRWSGRTLADLFAYLSEEMPKNDPGGLAPEEYADVVAYLLRLNAMPAGAAELRPDRTALAAIRIETAGDAPGAPGTPVRKDPR